MKLWTPCLALWTLLHQSAQRFLYDFLETPVHARVQPGSCWLAYEVVDENRIVMPAGLELQEMSCGQDPKKYLWFAVYDMQGPWRRGWRLDVLTLARDPKTRRQAWVHLDTRNDIDRVEPTALSLLECRVGNEFSFLGHPMPFPVCMRVPPVMRILGADGKKHQVNMKPFQALPLYAGNVHNSLWVACRAPVPSFALYVPSEVSFCTRRPELLFFHEYAVFNPYVLYD